MATVYDGLNDKLIAFIRRQKMFCVATAPLSKDGHVNVSPKGYESFAILGPNKVAYLDVGGSGIETQAHCQENGRITIMFTAYEGAPNIVRIYGKGTIVQFDSPDFPDLLALFPKFERARAIIVIDVTRVSDSCGWGVPYYEYQGEREQLLRYADNPDRDADYWAQKYRTANAKSIDGLPGILSPEGD